jgi:putative ABC transport system permease protein
MHRIAIRMLVGDRSKFIGLILGVAFSCLLLLQQVSIFLGLLGRAASVIVDVREADVWVMDPSVTTIDVAYPLRDIEVSRVRSVEGVAWAVPFFKANASVRTPEGRLENSVLLGVDDQTLVGVPDTFLIGSVEDLRLPDAIAIDPPGFRLLFPGEELAIGRVIELNDRRAVIRAIVQASAAFSANLIIYTRYSLATSYANTGRNQMSFVLAKAEEGRTPGEVAAAITAQTGLKTLTSAEFNASTRGYIIANTGIPISFGTVVALGILVGIAVVGLTFNQFISDNLKQYAALKAMGVRNSRLATMTLWQAAYVGAIGYGYGLGAAAFFFGVVGPSSDGLRGFYLSWQVALGVGVVSFTIAMVSVLVAMRKVLFVDPATVFRS